MTRAEPALNKRNMSRSNQSKRKKKANRIRAIIALIVLLAMMIGIIIPARAEEVVLGEIKAVLNLPEGWTQAEAAAGELLTADNAEGVHLRLVTTTGETSEDQWNYGDYGDDAVNNLGNALADRLTKADYRDVAYTMVKADSVKWLRLSWNNEKTGRRLYGIQYYTVVNGQGIELTFTSGTVISDEVTAQTEAIARSLSFAEIAERPRSTDSSLKTSFIWIALLILAAGFTYFLKTRGAKK